MSNEERALTGSTENRQERRFKVNDESLLSCKTAANGEKTQGATVLDLSTSGIRLLCEGSFKVGQTIVIELTTDRSHGTYKGVIRRVQPWVDGQSILGCSLHDPIPVSVLEGLSHEGVVNRRSDNRVGLNKKATVRWPLHQGEVDVEVQDYSTGGMKIVSSVPIPDDVRMRIRIDLEDEEQLIIDVKSVWQNESDDGCVSGVTYTHQETHETIARILRPADELTGEIEPAPAGGFLRDVIYTACVTCAAAIGVIVYMSMKM